MGKSSGVVAVTFYYDPTSGEMTRMVVSPEFKRESALLMADVWQDIERTSSAAYGEAQAKWMKELRALRAKKVKA